jgi:CDP-diacylglycerol---glycerol-3-phosphate 3-phosphatidyltransferase
VFMFFLFCHSLWAKVLAFAIFIFAALSDYLDGMIAHRRNMVTDFGRLMDPIADKILVLAAFAAFVQMQLIEAWMFVIIVSREILITSLRLFALNKGKVLSASKAGKHKTVSQMLVIFLILVFIVLKEVMLTFFTWNPRGEQLFRDGIYLLMLLTVALTLYSGLSYLWANRKIITRL